jgi:DMSO/TMAO reductase YedYZ molybdopterin-dependent catalytic subunit
MSFPRRLFFSTLFAPVFAADTPKRGGRVLSLRPQDYEMGLDGFLDYLTPIDRFYVRSHHYTPSLDAASFKLTVGGEVATPLTLTLEDLRKMPRTELVSVCECAGNGRSLYEPSIIGLQWEYGGVGNARWAGVRLADVLKRAGVKPGAKNVVMDGGDTPVGTMPDFQRSIPVAKALDPNTLLAYEMNGETLPVSHGFPLRAVVPGWAGDCWVKWLTNLRVINGEFDGFFMKTGYRHPGKAVTPGVAVDPAKMAPVESLRIKSVIAAPQEGDALVAGKPVRVAGAAWAGVSPVAGVEVSVDRGRTWTAARLGTEKHAYGWRLWSFDWTPKASGHVVVMARARDMAGDTQPFEPEWNPSGYLWNVVHRVAVHVVDDLSQAPAAMPQTSAVEVPRNGIYQQRCIGCHEEDVIAQQRLTRAQWDREVQKMINWGAQVKEDEKKGLIDYLVARFGPRPRR